MVVQIKGISWKFRLLSDKDFVKAVNKDTVGLTIAAMKEVWIREDDKDVIKSTVYHELLHAYKASCCVSDTELNAHQTEELFCEIMAHHGQEYVNAAKKIYRFCLKTLREHHRNRRQK